MKNKIIVLIIILILTCTMSSCSPLISQPPEADDEIPLLPGDTDNNNAGVFTLYYMLESAKMLTPELRTLTIPESVSMEQVLIQELIGGTYNTNNIVGNPINNSTRVQSVSGRENILFVTLSRHFLYAPSGFDEDWESDEELYNEVLRRRKLALYSIVNTVTELGSYSYVQFYIDYDNNGTGTRPTKQEMGIESEGDIQLIEPLSRDSEYIFTPSAAIHTIMNYIRIKEWNGVMLYTSYPESSDNDLDNIIKQLEATDFSLLEYTIHSQTIALDGKTSIIVLSYTSNRLDGSESSQDNISIRLVQEDGVWKCTLTSLYQILQKSL